MTAPVIRQRPSQCPVYIPGLRSQAFGPSSAIANCRSREIFRGSRDVSRVVLACGEPLGPSRYTVQETNRWADQWSALWWGRFLPGL
jgi:hypothetical protein